jgi:hypothetical protein
MRLTGKCKVDFEKWILKGVTKRDGYDQFILKSFYRKNYSMQYGVYVDFFDSVGISIEIIPFDCGASYYWLINDKEMNSGDTDTRPEARTEAINEANQICNEQTSNEDN